VGEQVLPAFKKHHGSADERGDKTGKAQTTGPWQLADEDSDKHQQNGDKSGEVQ
jgi:hypothetical protein